MKEEFEKNPELKTFFRVDPDSSFQSDKGHKAPGYNCQIMVDDKNKVIIAADVTNEQNDYKQLHPMLQHLLNFKKDLPQKYSQKNSVIVCDAGYSNESEILKCLEIEKTKILVTDRDSVVKKNKKKKNTKSSLIPADGFKGENFKKRLKKGYLICPEGKKLFRTHDTPRKERSGREFFEYHCNECNGCHSRNLCTNNKRGRSVSISANYEKMKAYKKKLETPPNKLLLKKRKEIVEHPFGTLKRTLGYTYFMQRGIEKVNAEFNFMCFVYNLKRILNIFTVAELLNCLKNKKYQQT